MKNQILLLALVGILLFSCKGKGPQSDSGSPAATQIDCTIVPGERVGLLSKDSCSREAVLAAYGDSALVDSIYLFEGMEDEGVVLFPNNPRRTAYIYWDKELNPAKPAFIRILGGETPDVGADWKTDSGIAIGTSIAEVERLNGAPFDFAGFGWDYGGRVVDWKGGKFDGTGFGLVFQVTGETTPEQLLGEIGLHSNDSLVAKAAPVVASFELRFPTREQLPACIAEKAKTIAAEEGKLIIQKMTVDGVDHYWFNTGAAAYDGVELVYDADCKEVCKLGGFRKPLDCSKAYEKGKWAPVWEE